MIMNVLGKPAWKLSNYSLSPEADNRFNLLFNSIIEDGARRLWEDPKFQKRDLEVKNKLWTDLVQKTRQEVISYMEQGVGRSGDDSMATMLQISTAHGQKKFDQAVRQLGLDDLDVNELTPTQLKMIEDWLSTRDSYIREVR